jgi:hypothetical protein
MINKGKILEPGRRVGNSRSFVLELSRILLHLLFFLGFWD